MGGSASVVLVVGAITAILCAAAALMFYVLRLRAHVSTGRRRRYGIVALALAGISVTLLAAEESVPRLLADRDLRGGCLPGPASTSIVTTPITWQVLTGGILVDAEVGRDTVETMIDDRLAQTPLADAKVILADDHIEIAKTIDSPLGELPIVLALAPTVSDGEIGFEPSSLQVNGVALSPSALDQLSQGGAGGLARGADSECERGEGSSVELVRASLTSSGLRLRLRL